MTETENKKCNDPNCQCENCDCGDNCNCAKS